ncbi:MAG TPA: class I SAM-dependent methyltransferase [Acidimicrobiales bacterium]|nr:class I SAM-dependent methyltransferase [Acidimicrobiales bacterium]
MIHESAARGYGNRSVTYQQARPAYHANLVERFVSRYGSGCVVDVGAGTGIFTAQLVAAGVSVVAVEPVPEMRARIASTASPEEVLDGTAEDLPLADDSIDTVVAAQAFHWFDHPAALKEMHRVLRLGGFLVTVWNVRGASAPWVAAYDEILSRYEGATPRHKSMIWREAIDADPRFEFVEDWGIDNSQTTDVEGVVQRALSTSFIAALPASEQNRVELELREAIEPYGPEIDFPYRSELQSWVQG